MKTYFCQPWYPDSTVKVCNQGVRKLVLQLYLPLMMFQKICHLQLRIFITTS